MHIAILEAGRTNPDMPAKFHHYPDMFETLFENQPNSVDFRFSIVPVVDDVFPQAVDDFDGYLVTGSAFGVYDDAPFIPKLMAFIQNIFSAGKPIVGVCFGHQIVAHAGGHAAKFDGGWASARCQLNWLARPTGSLPISTNLILSMCIKIRS